MPVWDIEAAGTVEHVSLLRFGGRLTYAKRLRRGDAMLASAEHVRFLERVNRRVMADLYRDVFDGVAPQGIA